MNKWVLVIVICFVILAGLAVMVLSRAGKINLPTSNQPAAIENKPADNSNATPASGDQPAGEQTVDNSAKKAELEALVNQRIGEKEKQIMAAIKTRPMNDDELDFFDHQRQNVINELVKAGKLSEADKTLLEAK